MSASPTPASSSSSSQSSASASRGRTTARVGGVQIEHLERRRAMRRFIAMGTIAWTVFILTDVLAAHVHHTPLEYLVAIRLVGTGIGLLVFLFTGLDRAPRITLDLVELTVAAAAGVMVSLAAIRCGGATSPLSLGVATCVLTRGILPAPWKRALPATMSCAISFPITILIASRFDPMIALQLGTPTDVWAFTQTSIFLVLGACVAAAGSHMLWSAKEQIHEARRLGTYRLVARIGTGGMGEVWLAKQLPLNRRVALKILKESTLRDPAALRRFRREAEAASSLVSAHTIRVFDFGASDDGVFFIAMELLDGLDLEEIVERIGPLPAPRVVHLARQVCDSLIEAHTRGIIHCDIKPANLFVTKVGDDYDFAKVLDFGLARLLVGHGHTTVDSIRGTPAFMPPEIIKGETVGPASDIYSMGAVLYWMLTGTPVFRGKGFHENVMAHLENKPERPSVRLGRENAVPRDLEDVILKCLEKRVEDRYATARDLEVALASCACVKDWTIQAARTSWEELRPSLAKLAVAQRAPTQSQS